MKRLLILAAVAACTVVLDACQPEPVIVEVESIAVLPTGVTMTVGDVQTLSVTVSPENATDKTVGWSSSKEAVVSVNADGVITALSPGLAEVIATSKNGKTAACRVAVKDNSGIQPAGL